MRLIDADALKEKITVPALGGHKQYYVWTLIDECPTIEAEPIKHGKWERHTNFVGNYYTCTVCKNVAREMPECMGEPIYEYCPNCGARMRGDEK